ncbi:MAG: sodium-independent anion transporter, partial [Gammaproteobacteria bacterium]
MDNIKGNLFGGITAAVVALPLALAFGVSSGAGAAAGLYGAIFTGLFAALFGGTKTQITGPTGPMTVVMAVVLTEFIAKSPEHGMALAFTTVILGGFFQIIFGLLRIGKYIILVPYPVVSGFMSGIGVIIFILQIGPFLGHPTGASVFSVLNSIPDMLLAPDYNAVFIGCVTLAVVYLWPAKLERMMPSPLAALIIGTFTYILFFADSGISQIGAIELGLPSLKMPYVDFALTGD